MITTEKEKTTSTKQAQYRLIISRKELEGRTYTCYGVALHFAGATVEVEDLSLDRSAVEQLVERCNRLELSPLHFQEVLSDFMESCS